MPKVSEKMLKGYNVAVHGIRNSHGSKEQAENIMKYGLALKKGVYSIRSTTVQIGDEQRNPNFKRDIDFAKTGYQFGIESEGYNVIIISPTVITNSSGEALFLGDPYTGKREQDMGSGGQQYEATSILDFACSKIKGQKPNSNGELEEVEGMIPSEFVYGYVDTNKGEIIKNPNHYSRYLDDKEKMDALFEKIKNSLGDLDVKLSSSIATNDKQALKRYKKLFEFYEMKEHLKILKKAKETYDIDMDDLDEK